MLKRFISFGSVAHWALLIALLLTSRGMAVGQVPIAGMSPSDTVGVRLDSLVVQGE
jgi:hypothetical protein